MPFVLQMYIKASPPRAMPVSMPLLSKSTIPIPSLPAHFGQPRQTPVRLLVRTRPPAPGLNCPTYFATLTRTEARNRHAPPPRSRGNRTTSTKSPTTSAFDISRTMGVTRTTRVSGTGPQPVRGQKVTIAYTGWLKDTSQPGSKGQELADSYIICH